MIFVLTIFWLKHDIRTVFGWFVLNVITHSETACGLGNFLQKRESIADNLFLSNPNTPDVLHPCKSGAQPGIFQGRGGLLEYGHIDKLSCTAYKRTAPQEEISVFFSKILLKLHF